MVERELERLVGAVIMPSVRPAGGLAPGAPERRPSRAYLERFPPAGLIGFGRRLPDGATIEGLEASIAAVRHDVVEPVFFACDLEEGAGYHLPGRTSLPPARGLAEAERVRPGSLFEAGRVTGLEARGAGIELVLGPVLDVNSNPRNPIIGARSFGTDVASVVGAAERYLAGLASAGCGASLKHFPGHGDTDVDSHLALPRIGDAGADEAAGLERLEALELAPFRALLGSPAARAMGPRLTVMAGHLDVPALTGQPGLATSLSKRALGWLDAAGFGGAVLTDGLEMLAVASEDELGVRSLEAGCHGLLAPADEEQLADELLRAVGSGRLAREVLERAADRMGRLAAGLLAGPVEVPGHGLGAGLGCELAVAALRAQPGWPALAEVLAGGCEEGLELVGMDCLTGPLGAGAGPSGVVRVGVASPKHPLGGEQELFCLIWFGTPESLPPWATGLPHVCAWAPGAATFAAARSLLGPDLAHG